MKLLWKCSKTLNLNALNKASKEQGEPVLFLYFWVGFGIMNVTTDGIGAGLNFA